MGGLVLARACGVPFMTHSAFLLKLPDVGRFRLGAFAGLQPLLTGPNHCRLPACLALPICSSSPSASPAASQTAPTTTVSVPKISFCPACGSPTEHRIPNGEDKPRAICITCGLVHYQNPKMVVGCLVTHEEKVLLCKRSIEPSYGLWTLPAGYMELGESAVEGAIRETWEEANAEVDVEAPFAQLDIPRIGQVCTLVPIVLTEQSYIIFRAKLRTLNFSPGVESLECALVDIDEIPFDQLAFSSINVVLRMYVEDYKQGKLKVHHGVIDKRAGASPSDPAGFALRDHICV